MGVEGKGRPTWAMGSGKGWPGCGKEEELGCCTEDCWLRRSGVALLEVCEVTAGARWEDEEEPPVAPEEELATEAGTEVEVVPVAVVEGTLALTEVDTEEGVVDAAETAVVVLALLLFAVTLLVLSVGSAAKIIEVIAYTGSSGTQYNPSLRMGHSTIHLFE